MHFELLAYIHYMVGIWDTAGPPSEPELLGAAGNLLRGLIREFIAAVMKHRQIWRIEADRATEVDTRALFDASILTNPSTLGDVARLRTVLSGSQNTDAC